MKKPFIFLFLLCLLMAGCHGDRKQQNYDPAVMQIAPTLSNQDITAFAEDSLGYIWMGTKRGLNRYNRYEFHQYFHSYNDTISLPSNDITALYTDHSGRLWVGTLLGACYYTKEGTFRRVQMPGVTPIVHQIWEDRQGNIFFNTISQLCRYLPESNSIEVINQQFTPSADFANECFPTADGKVYSVVKGAIRCFGQSKAKPAFTIPIQQKPYYSYLSRNGRLWVASEKEVHIYNVRTRREEPLPKALVDKGVFNNTILNLLYETRRHLFIVTNRSLYVYNYQQRTVTEQGDYNFPFSSVDGHVRRIFLDSGGNLWFALQMKGFEVRHSFKERFNSNPSLTEQLQDHSVTSLCTDALDNLWMLDANNQLWIYGKTGQLQPVNTDGMLDKRLPDENYASLFADSRGRVWVISNEHLYQATLAGNRLILDSKYAQIPKVACITEDHRKNLWVGGAGNAIYCLPPDGSTPRKLTIGKGTSHFVFSLCAVDDNHLLLGLGLANPLIIDTRNGSTRELKLWASSMLKTIVTSTCRFPGGNVAIATGANGVYLYNPKENTVNHVDGLDCNEVKGLQLDPSGNLWVSTLNGLSMISRDGRTVSNYTVTDGIGGNQFNDHAAATLPTGEIVFGGTHGLTIFSSGSKMPKRKIPIYFEDIRLNNNVLRAGPKACFDSILALRPKVQLAYKQNSFSVSFAAPDFRGNERKHFSYRLEGSGNDQWVDLRNGNEAWFNDLPAGHYRLHVRTVGDSSMEPAETSLDIRVRPAPWNTWWAWLLYLALAAYIAMAVYRGRRRIVEEKQKAQRMAMEKEQEERVNRMNMSYFSNISHEFRTPLTMIAGGSKMLSEKQELTAESRELLGTIRWNVQRMLRLISQMLDFNKLENDALPLQVQEIDVAEELRHVLDSVVPSMNDKHITLLRKGMDEPLRAYTDSDKLEKVVSNLLSNALKFTPEGGEVSCTLLSLPAEGCRAMFPKMEPTEAKAYVVVHVDDNGTAIPEDKLEKIFLKYYQVENHHNYGTGIGLYYCRRLMTLHHGAIKAANLPEGGVRFTLAYPLDDIYSPDEHAPADSVEPAKLIETGSNDYAFSPAEEDEAGKPKVVVVDDDPSVVKYLEMILRSQYAVSHAFNAEAALDIIHEQKPDLILSDVMMPGTDGMALCRKIKDDDDICHIPVILVTAKATPRDQVDGLHTGAEAYVTKPFDPEYLLALIASLLAGRQRMMRQLGSVTKTAELQENTLNPRDTAFMDNLYAIMEKEIANPELNINALAEKMGLSRSKLYYKMKALTGEKPLDFFKKYRLNRATELLLDGRYNVSEVAYKTGFSSLTVFSRSFKQAFGVAPSEYQK